MIQHDTLLKQITKFSQQVPPCVVGLLPEKGFALKMGRQLKGVPKLSAGIGSTPGWAREDNQ